MKKEREEVLRFRNEKAKLEFFDEIENNIREETIKRTKILVINGLAFFSAIIILFMSIQSLNVWLFLYSLLVLFIMYKAKGEESE